MKINLYGRKIFIDANAFIYFFTGNANDLTLDIFRKASFKQIYLITSTRVIDEVIYKLFCLSAQEKFGFTSKVSKKLRENKEKVKELSFLYDFFFGFLKDARVEIVTVTPEVIKKSKAIVETYGIFGNDAITLAIMRERNLKYILTADNDFSVVEDIEIINPKG
jgi:predicted nucleic acid-binding protein